jgi:hypothetical protein
MPLSPETDWPSAEGALDAAEKEFLRGRTPSEIIAIERKRDRDRRLTKSASVPSDGTAGPWIAQRRNDEWVIRSPAEDIVVAVVVLSRPGYSSPIDRADALKLAAAWEMLDLLERLVPLADLAFAHMLEEAAGAGDREFAAKMKSGTELATEARLLLGKATGSVR